MWVRSLATHHAHCVFEILSLKFDEDGTCFGNRELFGVLFELLIGVGEGDRFRLTASRYSLLPTLGFDWSSWMLLWEASLFGYRW